VVGGYSYEQAGGPMYGKVAGQLSKRVLPDCPPRPAAPTPCARSGQLIP
jgi:hypothetical protein